MRQRSTTWAYLVLLLVKPVMGGVITNYTITDLGTLGGEVSNARAINDAGQIAGFSAISGTSPRHGFRWDNGVLTDIGTLQSSDSFGRGVNIHGWVTGQSHTVSNNPHAVLWKNGNLIDLGTFSGALSSEGFDVNDDNQVVGFSHSFTANGSQWQPFIWKDLNNNDLSDPGEMSILGTLGGPHGLGRAINNKGEVVGGTDTQFGAPPVRHPFLWSEALGMIDLGTLGENNPQAFDEAFDINEAGQVVGQSRISVVEGGHYHAFIWDNINNMVDLGTLGGNSSFATAIDEIGLIVGSASDEAELSRAVVWDMNRQITDLNTLLIDPENEWERLFTAYDINEFGQIIGDGITIDGDVHGFLLTPVPEPSTLVIFVGLLVCRFRYRQ